MTTASTADNVWKAVGEALDGQGWRWRVVAVECLAEASGRISAAIAEASLPVDYAAYLTRAARAELPTDLPRPRSIAVGAIARPATQATLIVDGAERTLLVPPQYADTAEIDLRFARLVDQAVSAEGAVALPARLPLKTLAVGSGLARYGRNNIAYVDGLGSYLQLAACVIDLPAPGDAEWVEARALAACEGCTACARACPTGAISGELFTLHTDRCLTAMNETLDPIPDWVDPAWHSCVVGCLRCQQVCPANADVELCVKEPVLFSAAESAALVAGDEAALTDADVAARRVACGLDYDAALIARNLRLLLPL